MPKTNLSSRKIVSTRTSSVITRRKRFQMNKAKQQLQNQFLDDDMSSSSSFNEFRIVSYLFSQNFFNISFL